MLNILKNTINRVFASGVDSDASAFITATGLSGTTQKSAITTLVKDLKSSGLWSKMKAVYPMVTDNRNLFSYSEDFTNAFWVKNNSTVTLNSATAPNGTLTADTLIPSAGTNIDNPTVYVLMDTAAQTRTFSFYAKSAGYNYAYARVGGSVPVALALFDLSNGTVTQTQSPTSSASIESVGNGWYRCQMTYPNSATYYAPNIGTCSSTYTISSTGITTTTNGTSGIYIWGAQLEVGSTTSTYQPILTTPSSFMASQMKYNLKDARDLDAAFRLTWSGGWTYSATGATPNGTNAYADTKFIPSSYSSNGINYGTYIRTASNAAGYNILMGGYNSDGKFFYVGGGGESYLGPGTSAIIYANLFNGYYIRNGNSSGQIAIKNNVLIGTNAIAAQYTSANIYLGAINTVPNTPSNYSNAQIAFSHFSESLTQQEGFLLNQIVEKYQVALSRGVQAAQSFYYNSAYSNEANTYLYSTQITGTTQVSAINTLINGLKANNLWSKMKAVYPFVTDKTLQADMAAQMKFNLVNPQDSDAAFRLAFSGGWTYSANGAQPNGVNGFAYTSLIPDNNGLTANSNSLSFYSRTAAANGATQFYEMGSGDTAGLNQISLYTRRNTDIAAYDTGAFALNRNSYTNTDGSGYYIGKINSDLTSKVFRNGVLKGTKTITNQALLSAYQIYLGGFNENNTTVYFSPKQMAFAHIGTGLSDAEVAILNQLVTDYETTLNRNV